MSTRAIAFARTIILARILSPSQFGIFGIASLVIVFLEIFTETGINVFLIQRKKSIDKYLDTAWVVSIVRGFIIFLIIVALSGPISIFFNSPGSKNTIFLISFVSLVRGFINPSIVNFQKQIQFSKEFWFKLVVFLFDSTVAVLMSYYLSSAIGVVWGLIAGALLELVLSFVFVRPWPKLKFDVSRLREVLSKGKWLTGAGIFQFMFRQGDDAVVGKILGESQLGIYQVAYKIATLPISEITDVVGRVTLPVYVKISTDPRRLKRAFIKTTVTIALLAISLGIALFVFGESIVRIFLGSSWLEVVPLINVLIVFGVVQAIANSFNSLLLARGYQKYVTITTLINILGLAVTIVPLTSRYGLSGAVLAPLAGSILGLPVSFVLVRKCLSK